MAKKLTRGHLKLRRILKGMTQRELKKKTKLSQPCICQIAGGKQPSDATQRKLKRAGIPLGAWA